MRVIAGSARRLNLKTIPGMETRPTTDRIKETLFNILGNNLIDCNFLDLFAGSGQMGIEALSRGAAKSVFVEQNPMAVTCIKENLEYTKLSSNSQVYKGDVLMILKELDSSVKFDYIFMDPPYELGCEPKVLQGIKEADILYDMSLVIIEAAITKDLSFVENSDFEIEKIKKYKTNQHIFLRLKA